MEREVWKLKGEWEIPKANGCSLAEASNEQLKRICRGLHHPCLTRTITSKCEDINQPTRVMESSKVCGKQKCQAEIKMLAKFWKPMKFLSGLFLPASGGQPRYASYFRLPQK